MLTKNILTIVFCCLISISTLFGNVPVENALYALIRANGAYHEVFRGSWNHCPSGLGGWLVAKVGNSYVAFYDATGKEIKRERVNRIENIYKFVEFTQKRLTVLPKVAVADVVSFKAPGHQSIEMFDKDG